MAAAIASTTTTTRAAIGRSLRSWTSSSPFVSSSGSAACRTCCWRGSSGGSSSRALVGKSSYPGLSSRAFSAAAIRAEKHYTKAHEWVELSSDGKIGTIGISSYAAKSLGDVVYVELPAADLEVSAGDTIGAVESVKSASDIYSPLGGKVIETNASLEEKPGTINASPEEEGWIAKIEITEGEAEAKLEELMGPVEYKAFTESED